VQGNQDVWLIDETRATRFTFDLALDRFPLWSPDGSRILFDSTRRGTRDLYLKSSSGGGDEEAILVTPDDKSATDWSPDGRFVIYRSVEPKTGRDLMVLPVATRKPWVFLSTPFEDNQGYFSPDGRWVAYQSNESGRVEVYVRPFVEPTGGSQSAASKGGQWQVSTTGGIQPHWRHDGGELYYIGPEGQMMAAPTRATRTAFEVGTPVKLFDTHIYSGGADVAQGSQYDVSRDGRFLINTVLDDATAPITILQNWKPRAR
jgi:Tol biopolymer transport system component